MSFTLPFPVRIRSFDRGPALRACYAFANCVSRRRISLGASHAHIAFVFALVMILTGCAGKPGPELLLNTVNSVEGARIVTVYVATTRERDETGAFTSGRSRQVSYLRYKISIPPGHKAGNVEWPKSRPNPKTDFVTVEQQLLDPVAFENEISRKRNGKPPTVGLFIHGFNTNFTQSVFRTAQVAFDADPDATPVLFAWPSEATVDGYVTDKDAATYSRDQLTQLMTSLARTRTAGPITVMGHSMGAWLTVEALRQLRISGNNATIRRLQVILAAPDIDVDVFTAQITAIGQLSPPMTILVSRDDVALRVSEFLSSERHRVGRMDVNAPDVQAAVRAAGIQVVDITDLPTDDAFKHGGLFAIVARYRGFSDADAYRADPGLRHTGAFVFNAVGAPLSSPFVLAGQIIGGK